MVDIDTSADPTPPMVPGLVLGERLGAGAHGTVWSARDVVSGEHVAVKVLPAGTGAHEPAVHARVVHPHVVRLRNVVSCPDGATALVLDLAEGGSLADLLARRGRLDPGECVTVLVGLATAVADLHARGLAHGDLGPGNVVFGADGRPLLTDLGAAAVAGRDGGQRWGTPGFTDPRPGPAADPARDVYALGALLRACLAGGAPGPAAPVAALLAVAERCTDPDPARRPTAAALARLVWDCAAAAPVRLRLPAGAGLVSSQGVGRRPAGEVTRRIRQAAQAAADGESARRDARRTARRRVLRRVVLTAAWAAAALLVAVGGWTASSALRPAGPSQAQVADIVGDLAGNRAEAFRSASRAALAGVAEPGSAAMAADSALVDRLAAQRVRLEGLSFTVDDVRVEDRHRDRLTVSARVTTSAHRRVGTDGRTVAQVTASPPQRVRLVLVRHDRGWWVRSVTPA